MGFAHGNETGRDLLGELVKSVALVALINFRNCFLKVHEYLRTKLCSLYENDCIFDKFECCWNGSDSSIMTGSYNNFFRVFDRNSKKDVTMEASKDIIKPKTILKPRKVYTGNKRKKDEISVDCLDFNKKILHTAWHPLENILAVAATNNLFIFQDKF